MSKHVTVASATRSPMNPKKWLVQYDKRQEVIDDQPLHRQPAFLWGALLMLAMLWAVRETWGLLGPALDPFTLSMGSPAPITATYTPTAPQSPGSAIQITGGTNGSGTAGTAGWVTIATPQLPAIAPVSTGGRVTFATGQGSGGAPGGDMLFQVAPGGRIVFTGPVEFASGVAPITTQEH